MAVAERQFQTFRGGRFSLRACGANRAVVEFDGPLVRRISDRTYGSFTADGSEIVIDDLICGRKLFIILPERRAAYEEQETEPQKEAFRGIQHTYFFVGLRPGRFFIVVTFLALVLFVFFVPFVAKLVSANSLPGSGENQPHSNRRL